ncbi:MAG: phosphoglucosamine mutase [Chloroflexi bacterium]|nr:phosphoglucosamine mutase [Chloroflexota bacterium]
MSDSIKLFGTDGIRGVANQFPLTPEFITRIGSAIAQALGRDTTQPIALIGRDTRASGAMIENALSAGLMACGFDTLHVGVLPTPGIAFLTRALNARCGIAISASHNPYQDNGIKVFGGDGFKIPDESENEIETRAQNYELRITNYEIGTRRDDTSSIQIYFDFLLDAIKRAPILQGTRVVIDCNNGATFRIAPRVMRELGAEVIALNDAPDGININRGYDSLEPKLLRDTVLRERADFGVQFDGDGDRAVCVDERGNYIDGDFILAILARDLRAPTVVSTMMANIGLEKSLRAIGVAMERTAVGDRWVTERMRALNAQIGGEQSGHIVLFDGGHTTGDGIYTAVRIADVIARSGKSLATLAECMTRYPQVLINVRVPRKPPLENFPAIQQRVAHAQATIGDGARILLRYSGTENLARVMIEGRDATLIDREANAIADVIRETIT